MPSAVTAIIKKAQTRIPPEAAQEGAAPITQDSASSIMQQVQAPIQRMSPLQSMIMSPMLQKMKSAGGIWGAIGQQMQAQNPGAVTPLFPQQAQGGMSPLGGQGLTPEMAAAIMQRILGR